MYKTDNSFALYIGDDIVIYNYLDTLKITLDLSLSEADYDRIIDIAYKDLELYKSNLDLINEHFKKL